MQTSKYSFLRSVPCLHNFKHTNQAVDLLEYFMDANYKYIPQTFVYIKLITEVGKEDDVFDPIDVCGRFWEYFTICLNQNDKKAQISQEQLDEYLYQYKEVVVHAKPRYQMQILKFELWKNPIPEQEEPVSQTTIIIQQSILEALVATRHNTDTILRNRAFKARQQPIDHILGLYIQSPTVTKVSDYQKTLVRKWRSQKRHEGEPR